MGDCVPSESLWMTLVLYEALREATQAGALSLGWHPRWSRGPRLGGGRDRGRGTREADPWG